MRLPLHAASRRGRVRTRGGHAHANAASPVSVILIVISFTLSCAGTPRTCRSTYLNLNLKNPHGALLVLVPPCSCAARVAHYSSARCACTMSLQRISTPLAWLRNTLKTWSSFSISLLTRAGGCRQTTCSAFSARNTSAFPPPCGSYYTSSSMFSSTRSLNTLPRTPLRPLRPHTRLALSSSFTFSSQVSPSMSLLSSARTSYLIPLLSQHLAEQPVQSLRVHQLRPPPQSRLVLLLLALTIRSVYYNYFFFFLLLALTTPSSASPCSYIYRSRY